MATDEELRTQLAAILRANRELGPDYERSAVDQLVDVVQRFAPPPAAAPRRERVKPQPQAQQAPARRGGRWWLWVAAILAVIRWGPSLLRASGLGSLAWIPAVLVLVVAAQLIKVIVRWGRHLESRWDGPGGRGPF